MTVVTLGREPRILRLTTDDRPGAPTSLVAEIVMDGLRATRSVADAGNGFADLAGFVLAMAADWRGWDGTRRWESLEGELLIEAEHDGHVRLKVALRDTSTWSWTATALLTLEPGEQLSAAATALRDLAAGG